MNFAAFPGRHGRLVVLCGLSLLLHLLVIALIDMRITEPPPFDGVPGLAVRLVEPAPSAPAPVPGPAPAAEPALSAPTPALTPIEQGPSTAAPAAAPLPATPAEGAEPVQMPSRYRVTVPPSVTLSYEVRTAVGPEGEARLAWETDGVQYRLALDGIAGSIESEGGTDDAGLAPTRASYRQGLGRAGIAFDRERATIVLESLGRSLRDMPGSQDGATVLMQLSGIGLADPDQLQDTVEIYVARASGAAVERYRVLGKEQLATPLGAMEALRLARVAQPGELLMEVWLAPGQGWLPVQLRTTAPDGSTRTQALKGIQRVPAG
ncbi:DUF3108 domain-containing protein [Telluria aromaticivorans]|uniref:DUF3108 domain-containing protein n=1 Tax=Telluria aromaticivorans TaxID=2725995 RepID=A0A7Y2JXY6_9BURK|nr:DUF3108 domain-containing protein [Telluria aromaticivorans]NNG21799.1 DUF3108 domain-containing protein [Telluria aromaticivorans]